MAPTPVVATFNALPRPSTAKPTNPPPSSTSSSGASPNHWHISIHTAPITPPAELIFLLQPSTGYIHIIGPLTLSNLSTPAAKAEKLVPLLLGAFNEGLGGYDMTAAAAQQQVKGGGSKGGDVREKVFAPGSWSVSEKALAEAFGKELKRLKVRKECRVVGVSDAAEEKKVGAEWDSFVRKLETMGLHG